MSSWMYKAICRSGFTLLAIPILVSPVLAQTVDSLPMQEMQGDGPELENGSATPDLNNSDTEANEVPSENTSTQPLQENNTELEEGDPVLEDEPVSSETLSEETDDSLPINSPSEERNPVRDRSLPLGSASASSSTIYLLGPGDELAISVIGYPEFTGSQAILPDGSISLPLIGSVQASDRTLDSLSRQITQDLRRYLVNPVVNLSLQSRRPVWVTVGGEVARPGPIQISPSSDGGIPTLTDALIAAGGVNREADIRKLTVQRRKGNGETETLALNLWDSLGSPSAATELLLRDGDVIWVPELDPNDIGLDRNLVARSTLAPATVRVRVVGEVKRPGEVEVPPYSSLSAAVAVAGGPTTDAKLSEVGFVRMNDTGEVTTETVDLQNLVDTRQVQEGDVIIVPKTTFATGLDYFARLLLPFNFILNFLNF
jgi:polysaccharide export outer membrane protein